MQVVYGSYRFPADDTKFVVNQTLRESQPGVPFETVVTFDLEGKLAAATPAALAAATYALRLACMTPFRDLVVTHGGAVVEQLRTTGSTTGVRCINGPTFPADTPADFSTYRKFACQFEAVYPLAGVAEPKVLTYQQTVSLSGGEPVFIWQQAVNGPPKKVMTSPATPYEAVQTGQALGLRTWPNLPPPIFGAPDKVSVSRTTPRRVGTNVREFAIQWEYRFSSVTPLNGGPGLPP